MFRKSNLLCAKTCAYNKTPFTKRILKNKCADMFNVTNADEHSPSINWDEQGLPRNLGWCHCGTQS